MKFETVRIYFLGEFSLCCHPKILLPRQRGVTTSPLFKRLCYTAKKDTERSFLAQITREVLRRYVNKTSLPCLLGVQSKHKIHFILRAWDLAI